MADEGSTTDLTTKLRELVMVAWADGQDEDAVTLSSAAAEIERLQLENARLRTAIELLESREHDDPEAFHAE